MGPKSSTIAASVVKSELGIGVGGGGTGSCRFKSRPRVIWIGGGIILCLEGSKA